MSIERIRLTGVGLTVLTLAVTIDIVWIAWVRMVVNWIRAAKRIGQWVLEKDCMMRSKGFNALLCLSALDSEGLNARPAAFVNASIFVVSIGGSILLVTTGGALS